MALTSPRFVTGCAILFLVDILWTASSELTEHLYKQKHFNKPFFTAYIKSIMFTIYLCGFIFCDSWWSNSSRGSEYYSSIAENDQQNLTIDEEDDEEDDDPDEASDVGGVNAPAEIDGKNDAGNRRKKKTNGDEESEECEVIQQTIDTNEEEFEEINLNQPNVIVNTAECDVVRTPDRPIPKSSSSKQPSNMRSPYIGEAVWLPISKCSDTSSISGRSDEEDLHSDCGEEEDLSHLNETDDDKLLLIKNDITDAVDGQHGDTLEVEILQPVATIATAKLLPKSAFKQLTSNKQNAGKKHKRKRSVRFSKLMEVRHMTAKHAEDAFLSRLSYSAFMRHIYQKTHQLQNSSGGRIGSRNGFPANMSYRAPSLNIKETALLAFYFTSIWFTANLSFHFGLQYSEAGLVNVLSSTTPLFTLLLGLIFPSGVSNDSVSVTKLLAVALFISSVAVISTTEPMEPPNSVNSSSFSPSLTFAQSSMMQNQPQGSNFPIGSLWTICGAFFYSVYVVLMRYNVLHDSMLNFPMFFGFIGLFSLILMWPFILLLDFTQLETFEWPNNEQWFYLLVNGLCGTVISELLFLLGSFLTSSLVGTIAVSFTIPMAVFFDIFFKDITYPGIFFLGTVPMMLSFFVIILLTQYSDWDPIMSCIQKFLAYFHPHHSSSSSTARYRNMDDNSSVLQNLQANHSNNTNSHFPDESPDTNSVSHSNLESKCSIAGQQSTNCNRRFERYTNKEDDEDGEQTQALINDQDNTL